MDRGTWETILTRFQARARGYSVRKEVGRAREDFTDIVQEIDGGLAHLQWRDTVIPIPHFTDTGGLFLRPSSDASRPLDPGLDVRTSPQSPAAALSQERGGDRALLLQKSEAQRDDSGTKGQARLSTDRLPSSHAGGGGVGLGQRDQGGDKEGRATGSSGDSTSLWSSLEQDENFSRSHREMAGSTAATTLLPPVKSVVVYRNGDPFYNGRRFVVNQRQMATMEAFLNEVTQNIGAPLAVRTLYTPRQGHKVTDLQDLQTGAQYVAAGFERFKKLDVFRNGDFLCPPFRFIIPRSMRQDLEQILSLVTEKVCLRTGAVRRLCSLEGVTVSSAVELETGHCYVAVGTERFKKLPYVELLVSKAAERHFDDFTVDILTLTTFTIDILTFFTLDILPFFFDRHFDVDDFYYRHFDVFYYRHFDLIFYDRPFDVPD
ncbi:hypothetical protein F2P81_003435 [Scophthalmus maximus]|uniref:Doublecortin domain-containing protein n=1 Tax=Scophthalmus maximus TaxID=52904 RepID=A0A6A4TCP9_SCOMX|nr:hypothetical protein F2P81_003435 [Scophthalmus maximus]